MTTQRGARRLFLIAGLYGLAILLPMYLHPPTAAGSKKASCCW